MFGRVSTAMSTEPPAILLGANITFALVDVIADIVLVFIAARIRQQGNLSCHVIPRDTTGVVLKHIEDLIGNI